MKKLLLLFPLVLILAGISAQIPNSDFEFWTTAPNLLNWQTNSYPLTLPPWDPYVVKKDSDRYSGQWAADLYGNGIFKPWAKTTFPVSNHPAGLSLYYKLLFPPCINGTSATQDTASVLVELLSNGSVVDQGYWQSTTVNSVYAQLIVALSQNAVIFDSCRITLTGGKVATTCQGLNAHTEFKVDYLQLSYSNSASCIDSAQICDTCACVMLYQPVCGCNGVTYGNSCEAYNSGVTSWSSGSCGSNGCIDSGRICDTCICPQIAFPVCGCNGVTYINSCYAINAGVLYWTTGACPNNGCNAYFLYTADSTGLVIDFADASSGSYDSLHWDFGDGHSFTTGIGPVNHAYAFTGLYNVCLTIFSRDSSCNNTYCQTLAMASTRTCPDTSVIQSNYTCDTAYNPVCGCDYVTYRNACEAFYHYGVTSFTSGQCFSTSPCQPSFYYFLDSSGYTVSFQYSQISNGPPQYFNLNLQWSFGDGTSDTGLYPVHHYTDTSIHAYWVCVTANDTAFACTNTFCDSVRLGYYVYGCYAGFGYTIDSTGVVTVFPDSTSGGTVTGSGWIIGSDTLNTNPTFQVDSNSNYNICYVVMNDSMRCTDTVCVNAQQIYAAYRATNVGDYSNLLSRVYLYPNPTQNTAELRFNVTTGGVADVTVRSLVGEIVYRLPQQKLIAGSYTYPINLSDFSGGIYLVELRLNNATLVRKLVKM